MLQRNASLALLAGIGVAIVGLLVGFSMGGTFTKVPAPTGDGQVPAYEAGDPDGGFCCMTAGETCIASTGGTIPCLKGGIMFDPDQARCDRLCSSFAR